MQSPNQDDVIEQLGNYDILIVMNWENEVPPLSPSNKAAVETALSDGTLLGLVVYDRFAGYPSSEDVNVPGLGSGKSSV